MRRLPRAALVIAGAALATSCATAASSIRIHVSRDPHLQHRIHQIGTRLADIASRSYQRTGITWRFGAIERHPFGASASRDGLVTVDAAFARALRPDELACALSHEIGHVIKGHQWPGKSNEEEADAFAVWLTIGAGYRPDACIRAFERLDGFAPHAYPVFPLNLFVSHPPVADRIAFVQREAERYRRR